jgi:hypothetical protein
MCVSAVFSFALREASWDADRLLFAAVAAHE